MSQIEVIVGTVGRAHGLNGEVFVDLSTDSPEQRFATGAQVWAAGVPLTVTNCRYQGIRTVVAFGEVQDRTEAEKLTGVELVAYVDANESPDEVDEFYDHQLVGLDVLRSDGVWVGTVSRVDHLGFQDLLVIETATGERLVPFVDALVPEVDLQAHSVVVRAIPGLLEDEE